MKSRIITLYLGRLVFKKLLSYFLAISAVNLFAAEESTPAIEFDRERALFVREPVPKIGIVCSNADRVNRLRAHLKIERVLTSSWGTVVYVGVLNQVSAWEEPFFIALAPVGTGSGLVFTELYGQGAEAIIRYGSDDIPSPELRDYSIMKIIDEADNLYGFSKASGVEDGFLGMPIQASNILIQALLQSAGENEFQHEIRICHHLENYHALRNPNFFKGDRCENIKQNALKIIRQDKKESMDMETAVLFQVAKDFGRHAASVLQTVAKEKPSQIDPYTGAQGIEAKAQEAKFLWILVEALKKFLINV